MTLDFPEEPSRRPPRSTASLRLPFAGIFLFLLKKCFRKKLSCCRRRRGCSCKQEKFDFLRDAICHNVLPAGPIYRHQNGSHLDDSFSTLLDGCLVECVPLEKELVGNVLEGDSVTLTKQHFLLASVSLAAALQGSLASCSEVLQ